MYFAPQTSKPSYWPAFFNEIFAFLVWIY